MKNFEINSLSISIVFADSIFTNSQPEIINAFAQWFEEHFAKRRYISYRGDLTVLPPQWQVYVSSKFIQTNRFETRSQPSNNWPFICFQGASPSSANGKELVININDLFERCSIPTGEFLKPSPIANAIALNDNTLYKSAFYCWELVEELANHEKAFDLPNQEIVS